MQFPIGQNMHLPVGNAAVHPAGHLEQLVVAEVAPGQHIPAMFDHVGELRIVDHHRIQPLNIEGRLPRGGHRQKKRLIRRAIEERSQNADHEG